MVGLFGEQQMGINPYSPGSPNKQNEEQQLGINLGSPNGRW